MTEFANTDRYQNQMAYWPPSKEIAPNNGLSGPSNCNETYQNASPSEISYTRPSYSDCYHNGEADKKLDSGSSHLSFLYDRAQGPCDGDKSPTPANSIPYSPDHPGPAAHHIINGDDRCISSEMVNRAVPAKLTFPHTPIPVQINGSVPMNSSSINQFSTNGSPCPTGKPGEQKQQEYGRNNTLPSGHVVGHVPNYGGSVERQRNFSNSSESELHKQEDSNRKPWSYSPQFGSSADPKNITRQRSTSKSHPIPDYLSFRKMSVPLVATRPKIQVADYSSDDQLADHSEIRSLQRASSEVDHSSVHQLLREGDEIGVYHQKSIRYTGRTNPSKIFKLLQAATGSEGELLDPSAQSAAKLPPRRRVRKQEPAPGKEENNADDVVDISYVGGNIPSRTFRNLQEAMGETDNQELTRPSLEVSETTPLEQVRSVKVIHLRPRKSIDNGITDF